MLGQSALFSHHAFLFLHTVSDNTRGDAHFVLNAHAGLRNMYFFYTLQTGRGDGERHSLYFIYCSSDCSFD